jgi:hypothetical protein
MKKHFFLSLAYLMFLTGVSQSFADQCFVPSKLINSNARSQVLLIDAFTRWKNGDYIRFGDPNEGMATQYRRGVPYEQEIDIVDIVDQKPGFMLLGRTFDDLQALVKEEPSLCHYEETGFYCHVGKYYCACYYGDPDGQGAGCHCAKVGDENACGREPQL